MYYRYFLNNKLSYTLLLHIYHHGNKPKTNFRLIWCPYLPSFDDDDASDDPAEMFVVLSGNRGKNVFINRFTNTFFLSG